MTTGSAGPAGPTLRNVPSQPIDLDDVRDDVDEIVASWHRERPDLDTAPLAVLSRVSRLAKRLDVERGQSFGTHGIESWEFDVLSALRRAGEPYRLTPSALVQQTLVTSGTMTNRVSRLEYRGLVERTPDPRDGRGVLVSLTPRGLEVVDAAMAELLQRERELVAELTEQDLDALAGLLRRLLVPLERRA